MIFMSGSCVPIWKAVVTRLRTLFLLLLLLDLLLLLLDLRILGASDVCILYYILLHTTWSTMEKRFCVPPRSARFVDTTKAQSARCICEVELGVNQRLRVARATTSVARDAPLAQRERLRVDTRRQRRRRLRLDVKRRRAAHSMHLTIPWITNWRTSEYIETWCFQEHQELTYTQRCITVTQHDELCRSTYIHQQNKMIKQYKNDFYNFETTTMQHVRVKYAMGEDVLWRNKRQTYFAEDLQ